MTVTAKPATQRLRITLRGAVQGVGFRPFVYRLATEMSLTGWVLNSSAGLVVAQQAVISITAASIFSQHNGYVGESTFLSVECLCSKLSTHKFLRPVSSAS
jgi:hypothetical protein